MTIKNGKITSVFVIIELIVEECVHHSLPCTLLMLREIGRFCNEWHYCKALILQFYATWMRWIL